MRRPKTTAMIHGVLLCGAAVTAFPFFWMVSSSLKSNIEAIRFPPSLVPHEWLWQNYASALGAAPFPRYFLNSLIQSVGVAVQTFCQLPITSPAWQAGKPDEG